MASTTTLCFLFCKKTNDPVDHVWIYIKCFQLRAEDIVRDRIKSFAEIKREDSNTIKTLFELFELFEFDSFYLNRTCECKGTTELNHFPIIWNVHSQLIACHKKSPLPTPENRGLGTPRDVTSGPVVRALDSGSDGPGSSPGWGTTLWP